MANYPHLFIKREKFVNASNSLTEGDILNRHRLVEENLRLLAELLWILCGEIMYLAVLRTALFELRMAQEILLQAAGHILTLRDDTDARRQMLQNLRQQQGIMGAAEDDGIDLRILTQNLIDALLDEIVGAGGVGFIVFHQRHPERTGHARDLNIGMQLMDLEVIALALDGALGGKDAYMARLCQTADNFCRGPDNAQHTARGVDLRQIVLLNAAQGFRRGGVAAQDDEMATHLEELQDGLARKLIDHVEGTRSVRGTGIVAQIKIIVLGKLLADGMQDGQSAVAAVEDAYRARITGEHPVRAGR